MDKRKMNELIVKLGKKLAKAFEIDEYLAYFLEKKPEVVQHKVQEMMKDENFPQEAQWDKVRWEIRGKNKTEFSEWVRLGFQKGYLSQEDIKDKLNDFIRSDRDYKMYTAEWEKLMNIEIILKETAEEYLERQGKADALSKHLSSNFDPDYIGEKLKEYENLSLSYNPVMDLFNEQRASSELGDKATVLNTRFKVLVSPPDFEEVASSLTMMIKDQGESLDNLLEFSGQALNAIYFSPYTLHFLPLNVQIQDTVEEWEERNQVLASPARAKELLTQKISDSFDGAWLGEEMSDPEMLQHPQNVLYQRISDALGEAGFPRAARPENVDFKAVAESLLDFGEMAARIIDLAHENYEGINNMLHSPADRFNMIWKTPEFIRGLDYKVTLMQTVDEWLEEHPEVESEMEY